MPRWLASRRRPLRPGPWIPATVRERGDVVVDGPVSWPGLVSGLSWYLYQLDRELTRLRPRRRPA
ncbi:MAG: hypothetical protein AUI14_09860 [Actinobacteria bacterium 13_2_20CM_2_71_6]|nr:MAG: hypothetical protein AUI14_09860 [Actinobacteria bacterium 13_2_20CM_2_71_6]